jgi:Schwannomin-interacting protein 1
VKIIAKCFLLTIPGMNLQICFMNETASDTESPSSDSETCPKLSKSTHSSNQQNNNHQQHHHQVLTHNKLSSAYINPYTSRPLSVQKLQSSTTPKISTLAELGYDDKASRPTTLSLGPPAPENSEIDFFTKQAKLQIEARMALAQAKDMAHMQMEVS